MSKKQLDLNLTDPKRRRGETANESKVNLLTFDELKATILYYESKYVFETNLYGCQIMGHKKVMPSKRPGRPAPKWDPLARRNDGYLQVTVQLTESRNVEIYGTKRKNIRNFGML